MANIINDLQSFWENLQTPLLNTSIQNPIPEINQSIGFLFPEVILFLAVSALIFLEIGVKKRFISAQLGVLVALMGVAACFVLTLGLKIDSTFYLFSGHLVYTQSQKYINLLLDFSTFASLLLVYYSKWNTTFLKPELKSSKASTDMSFSMLSIALLLSARIWVLSGHWITAYIALELISLSSYFITVYQRNTPEASEAGVKYLIYGSFCSALLLLGVSYFFGITGDFVLNGLSEILIPFPMLVCIFALWWAGIAFKIGAVPFHFWVPEVYQVAPVPALILLSIVPKIAGIYFLWEIINGLPQNFTNTIFISPDHNYSPIIAILGVVTMSYGNILALSQTSFRRMVGFSGIAQTGFLLCFVAFEFHSAINYNSFLGFAIAYSLATVIVWIAYHILENKLKSDFIDQWRGGSQIAPLASILLSIGLISLTGLPPTAGFLAKVGLLAIVTQQGQDLFNFLSIAIIINTVISLFYYFRPIAYLYFTPLSSTEELNTGELTYTKEKINFLYIFAGICALILIGAMGILAFVQ